jgi:hypothetical protein
MGHEVFEGSIPTNAQGQVVHQLSTREYAAAIRRMPTWEQLESCDAILVSALEYMLVWLNTLYGKERWCSLNVPRIALYAESSEREDHQFKYQNMKEWSTVQLYPDPDDAKRFGGHYIKGSVDTTMFKPCRCDADGHVCDDSCLRRSLQNKKYDAAFVGSLWAKRIEFLRTFLPHIEDIHFIADGIVVHDLSGERHRDWAELLAENLRQIKIHVALPSNNSKMMVSRPLETMACGTFLLTYPTTDNLLRDGEHCRFYDPDNPVELGNLIRYYLQHEDERELIARNGLEEVRRNFSLEARLSEILGYLDGCKTSSLGASPTLEVGAV